MHTSTTVTVIGAGQAGLAMSRCLSERSIDHVVLERGEVANSWRTERWDSLRLLTPNWMTRLPSHRYEGDDPDGYMTADEVVAFLAGYGERIEAPVRTHTEVRSVATTGTGFRTTTTTGTIDSAAVVVATGACSTPHVPAIATELPSRITQLTPIHYRNPEALGDGHVLVVGASASGAQIADELRRAGRQVTLAVGDHVRLPRTYRGMDIHWWMDAVGILDEHYDEMEDSWRRIAYGERNLTLPYEGDSSYGRHVFGLILECTDPRNEACTRPGPDLDGVEMPDTADTSTDTGVPDTASDTGGPDTASDTAPDPVEEPEDPPADTADDSPEDTTGGDPSG